MALKTGFKRPSTKGIAPVSLEPIRSILGAEPSDHDLEVLLKRAGGDLGRAVNHYYEGTKGGTDGANPFSAGKRKRTPEGASGEGANAEGTNVEAVHGTQASSPDSATRPQAAGQAVVGVATGPLTAKAQRKESAPLAERMRPQNIDHLVGQDKLVNGTLRRALDSDRLPSLLLWGPPGCGKTSFARVVSETTKTSFRSLSAAKTGKEELTVELVRARNTLRLTGRRTTLFIDEIHRWNKAQQDALLAESESGAITLIGATTENPSFSVNNAVISRCTVIKLEALAPDAIVRLLKRALAEDGAIRMAGTFGSHPGQGGADEPSAACGRRVGRGPRRPRHRRRRRRTEGAQLAGARRARCLRWPRSGVAETGGLARTCTGRPEQSSALRPGWRLPL